MGQIYNPTLASGTVGPAAAGDVAVYSAATVVGGSTNLTYTAGNLFVGPQATAGQITLGQKILMGDGTNPNTSITYNNTSLTFQGNGFLINFTSQGAGSVVGNGTGTGTFMVNTVSSSTVPIYAFAGDTTTGLGRASAGILSLTTVGIEGLRVDANQTVYQNAGQIVKVRVVTAAGSVTVATNDYVVEVNKTAGAATTVNLPAGVTGTTYRIKDGKGDAGTNNITVTPAAGNIDGAATKVINTNFGSIDVVYDGTQWIVL